MPVPLFTHGMLEASDCSEVSVKGGGEKWQLTQAWCDVPGKPQKLTNSIHCG